MATTQTDKAIEHIQQITGLSKRQAKAIWMQDGNNLELLKWFVDWWQRQGYALRKNGETLALDGGGTGNIENMLLRFLAWYKINIKD